MKKVIGNFLVLSSGFCIVLGFQNCTKVRSTDLASTSQKVSGDQLVDSGNVSDPQVNPTDSSRTAPAPADESVLTALDPREIHCQSMVSSKTSDILFDQRALSGKSALAYGSMAGDLNIEQENISSISSVAGNINVVASSIGSISSIASRRTVVNAQSVGRISSFAGNLEVTTHEISFAGEMAAEFCLSAQTVGRIGELGARLSLYGRNEDGKRATIEEVGSIAGFLSVYNFDFINGFRNAAVLGKFVNSHIPILENAAVDLILVDTTIDEILNSSGRIVLKGNSKILKLDASSVNVIQN